MIAVVLACWLTVVGTVAIARGGEVGEVGEIAFIGSDGQLRSVDPDGRGGRDYELGEGLQTIAWPVGGGRPASAPMIFSWPTWSPDGRRLLAFGRRLGDESTGGLYVFDRDSGRVRGALDSLSARPIYAFWSPDGARAAVLGEHQRGLRLALWPSETRDDTDVVLDAGMPFFWDWRRDSRSLVMHTGDDPEAVGGHTLSLLDVAGRRARSVLSREPAEFGPPSWSANGEWLAYAEAVGPRKARLVVARADGSEPIALIEAPNRLALNWSPKRSVLAVAKAGDAGEAHLTELLLFDLDKAGGPRRSAAPDFSIVREPFVAFFWAPSGDRLLLAETSSTTTHWHWRVVELDDGEIRDVAEFIPSRPDLKVFRYFDQYALSHRLWSPDGRRFVFTGLAGPELGDAVADSISKVYVADLDRPGPPRAIADGHMAFWSPR